MSEVLPLLRALLVGLLVGAVALRGLSRPVASAMLRIAPRHPAAAFRVRQAQLSLAGVPAALGLVVDLLTRRLPWPDSLQLTLAACVIGVILVTNETGKRVERIAFLAPPAAEPADPGRDPAAVAARRQGS